MNLEIPQKRHKHFDFTPLIDIMFNILLFFVLTYQVSRYSEIKVNLPQSEVKNEVLKGIDIVITKDYKIYFNKDEVLIDEISKKLYEYDKKMPINIKADREIKLEFGVKVFEQIRKSGFEEFSIITE